MLFTPVRALKITVMLKISRGVVGSGWSVVGSGPGRGVSLARRGKTVCPRCGRKTFVNYVYDDGRPVADGECGKCDRADKCGAHIPPRVWFGQHGSLVSGNIKGVVARKPLYDEPSLIDTSLMERTLCHYDINPLARWLHGVFDSLTSPERVDALLRERCVGTSRRWGGATVYWQVDTRGRVRTGKVMGYNPETGRRIHQRNNWVHCLMPPADQGAGGYNLRQCYFGSHIPVRDDQVIWLFESEKAALVMDMLLEWGGLRRVFVPMATSGCGNLNPTLAAMNDPYDKLQVLRGRKVVLFPDEGKFREWEEKGRRLKGFCEQVWIATVMERGLHRYPVECPIEPGDGFDDLVLRYLAEGRDVWDLIVCSY